MQLSATALAGLYVVDIDKHEDNRGFFARMWDLEVAKNHGLQAQFDYVCISGNTKKHTLRGMHYQKDPHGEVKLVSVTKGKIFDVAIDLRKDSKTFQQWFGVELSSDNHKALYIPSGFAHGFLTLEDDTEVLYHISGECNQTSATGVRFDDPAFDIQWPKNPIVISDRDKAYPDFQL